MLPVIQGFVQELPDLEFSHRVTGTLTVVARRSVRRLGTRNWRRGADLQVLLRRPRLASLQVSLSGLCGKFCRDRTASVSVEWTCVFVRSAARIDPRVLDQHSKREVQGTHMSRQRD